MPPHIELDKVYPHIDSHTSCEFGKYDSEPFPTVGDAKYWYTRAVYWKCQCERENGHQDSMNFAEPSTGKAGEEKINQVHVLYLLTTTIKYVRDMTGWGLIESKDWVKEFQSKGYVKWGKPEPLELK